MRSAVHPEAYALVEQIAEATKRPLKSMIGDRAFLQVAAARGSSPTRRSACRPSPTSSPSWRSPAAIRAPSSRPRPSRTASRRSRDLKPGMQLEGVVTNVTAFGAFVDVGVHQDGLVHISELSDRFVKDPREVVKAGDMVKVRVKEVDVARKRIALTMKSGAIQPGQSTAASRPPSGGGNHRPGAPIPKKPEPQGESAFAAALRRAQQQGKGW